MRLKFYIEGSEPGVKGTVHTESKEVGILPFKSQLMKYVHAQTLIDTSAVNVLCLFTSTYSTLLCSIQFRSFSIICEYHLDVGGVVVARRAGSPLALFVCDTNTMEKWRCEPALHSSLQVLASLNEESIISQPASLPLPPSPLHHPSTHLCHRRASSQLFTCYQTDAKTLHLIIGPRCWFVFL